MSHAEFDAEKARELREHATGAFVKQTRRGAFAVLLAISPFLILAAFAGIRWGNATEAESRTLYAVLYLISVQMAALLGLGFFLKLRFILVMKEIKQLRMDTLAEGKRSGVPPLGGAESLYSLRMLGIAPWTLFVLIPLFAVATAAIALPFAGGTYRYTNERKSFIALHEDGSARALSSLSFYNSGPAMEELSGENDLPAKNVMLWDERGRQLAPVLSRLPDGRYLVSTPLLEPVMQGEQLRLKGAADVEGLAKKEGDEWVVSDKYSFGGCGGLNKLEFGYLLPPGAVITEGRFDSVTQTPKGTLAQIKLECRSSESCEVRFKYRLNAEKS